MNHEPAFATTSIVILLLVWIGGMVFEPSHDFAGSALGGALALTGTLLLLAPLLYWAAKRSDLLKSKVVRHIPMRTISVWHIYTGLLGTIFVLLHTGHKFNSVLAAVLTAVTLAVVSFGVIGRYLQRQIGDDVRTKRKLLGRLYQEYDVAAADTTGVGSVVNVVNLVSSIADVEWAISARETLKRWFSIWYRTHIVLVVAMYLLLILHIWSGIHFGLRWFQ